MFSIFTSISALVALTFLTQASTSLAGHVRHRHGARMIPSPVDNKLQVIGRRAAAGMTEIPTGQLQMLQSEMTTFQGWMDTYINSTKEMDQATALAQLKQEFEAFNGWVNAFLSNVMGTGPSTLPALPTTAPLTASPQSSVVAAFSSALSTAPASYSSLAAILASSSPALAVSTSSAVAASSSPSSTSVAVQELVASPSHTAVSTTLQVVQSPLSSAPISSTPSLPASSALSSTPQTSASAASSPVPSPSSPSGGTGGSFNANSDSNVAVYYGQSGATGQFSLEQMCQDSNVDIVILAFVSTFFGAGGYPTINLGAACSGTTAAMSAKGATGLLSCPTVAQQITTCQGLGKKVLVSLGGAIGTSAFSGTQQADQFATMLWNLFGAGTGEDAGLRPFGQVKVDGFDLDNEDHSTTYYTDFVTSLRTTMSTDTSKTYYISAAPQCPRPDASIPLDAMQTMDFVFVQFYNNAQAGCDVGLPGFLDSFKAWSGDLSANGGKGPKLYIGAPGCQECAGAGYVDPATMGGVIASAKGAGVSNLGGVMLWDGPESKENVSGGQDYLEVVKEALG